jgi:hypothetical protein
MDSLPSGVAAELEADEGAVAAASNSSATAAMNSSSPMVATMPEVQPGGRGR